MAEKSQEALRQEAINAVAPKDVQDFLEEKGRIFACPVCSENKWTLIDDGQHLAGILATPKNGGFPLPPPNLPVAVVACLNCAYVRLHALGIIAEWKNKKTAKI